MYLSLFLLTKLTVWCFFFFPFLENGLIDCRWGNVVQSLQCYLGRWRDDVTFYHCTSWFISIEFTRNLITSHRSFKFRNSFQIVSFVVFERTLFVLFLKRCFSAMSVNFIKQSVFTFLLFVSWYKLLTS